MKKYAVESKSNIAFKPIQQYVISLHSHLEAILAEGHCRSDMMSPAIWSLQLLAVQSLTRSFSIQSDKLVPADQKSHMRLLSYTYNSHTHTHMGTLRPLEYENARDLLQELPMIA